MLHMKTGRLLGSYFLYECGRAMYFVLTTWILFQWTNDPLYTGLFVSFGFLPGMVSNLFFGVLVDRYSRKKLAVAAGASSVLILLFLWTTFAMGTESPWLIILVHMLLQTAGSLFRPALQALTAAIFPKDALPKIFSWSNSSTITGSLIGAGGGGVLAGTLPAEISLGVVLLLFTASTLSVMQLGEAPFRKEQRKHLSFFLDMKEGFRYVHHHPLFYGLFFLLMIGQLTFHTSLGFLSVYTSAHLLQGAFLYGLLDAVFSIGGMAAGLLGTWWWKLFKNSLAVWAFAVTSCGLLFVSLTNNVWPAFIGFFLIGFGTSCIRALLQSVQQMASDPAFHGRLSSLRMLANQSSVVLSGPLFGAIASTSGVSFVFLWLLLPAGAGILWAHIQSRHPDFQAVTNQRTA
ncbi:MULTISPECIES: MFS transporter [Halobacillus]|uniref:MFS transporter n=1 Tax=Halobacillus TaxID=45667 RepID=UPI00041CC26E|nr:MULTISPECIES: MFS transporter [Halobacillus]